MNKIIATIIFVIIGLQPTAQTIYSTKSASIYFIATGGLEKIEAINDQADCKLLDNSGQIVVALLIKGFKFENQLMEDHFNENYLESTKFPKAIFKGFISNISSVNFTKDGTYYVDAEGTLTIHGTDKKVKSTGTITISRGKVSLNSTFQIKLNDYQISGSYIGDKIASETTIKVKANF